MKICTTKKIQFFIIFFVLLLTAYPVYSQVAEKETGQKVKSELNDNNLESAKENKSKIDDNNNNVMKTESDNLFTTVKQGGVLMIPIIFLGIIALTIIIERLIYFTKNKVWTDVQLIIDMREIAENSKIEFREEIEEELRGEFQIYANGLEKGLSVLAGIGNLAPILGFLGTVVGMISAFGAIAAANTVNAKVVAVGIQVALITTAGGLIVAAPALAFYYLFSHIIQNRFGNSEEIISEVCENLPRISDKLQK